MDFSNLTLPFAARKQAAVLWYLLTNRNFFERAKNKIKPQWFAEPIVAKVYTALVSFAEAYARLPSKQELLESRDFMIEEPAVRSAMRATVEMACNEAQVYGLDVLKAEMTEWLHASIYKDGMEQSARFFQQQKFAEAYRLQAEHIRLIQESKFEDGFVFDFTNLVELLGRSEARVQNGCTFGLKLVDDAFSPKGVATAGGLFRGDTTCLMAPVNAGKTSVMLSVVAANIRARKRVMLIIHEGDPGDILDKLLCNLLQRTKQEIWALRATEQGRRVLDMVEATIKTYLTFIPYIRAQMTIEDIIPIMRQICEEAQREGRPFDLLANDYPALLMSDYAKAARMEDRTRIEMIYRTFTQLAAELGVHCLVNIQTNREGSKVAKHEDRLIWMEDVAECWGAMAKVTNCVTVTRTPSDMEHNRLTFLIVKSRSNATGLAVVSRTDFDRCVTHSDQPGFGASYYRYRGGKGFGAEELAELLPQCIGGELRDVRAENTKENA